MITRLLLVIFLFSSMMSIASQKQLDAFKSNANFYTAANPGGSGSINTSIDNTIFKEGNSSLKVTYSLNAATGNFVEVYNNYGSTKTLDLSFMPDKLTLWVLGQAGNSDVFKFMLYEDQDMDGNPFESGDEIYVISKPASLSNNSWSLLDLPFSAFTRLQGSGNNKLDLNRIGAWRIVIENGTGTSHSGTVYFDDLEQHTTYVPTTTGTPKLTGAFIQLWNNAGCNCGQWSQPQWNDQLKKMKEVCMDNLIIQYGVYGDNAWYTPSSLSYVTYKNSTLDYIFNAAKANGIKVYLGLYFDENWNSFNKSVASNYTNLLQKQKDVLNEMYALFGDKEELEGWYIPQELNDLEWQSVSNRDLVSNYFQNVASYAHTKDASKKVMIAPFFGPYRPADDLQNWYEAFFTVATDIDAIYPQDGVGTTSKDVDVDIPHYFNALKSACVNKGVLFGATVESFLQTDGYPVNNNPFASGPTPIANFKTQLQESGKLTTDLITFEWGYMQPGLSTATQKLYDDYKTYANCTTTSIVSDELDEKINIFPVPVKSGGIVTVSSQNVNGVAKVSILNLMGQEVYSTSFNEASTIELKIPSNISSGTYMLLLNEGNIARSKMIVIE